MIALVCMDPCWPYQSSWLSRLIRPNGVDQADLVDWMNPLDIRGCWPYRSHWSMWLHWSHRSMQLYWSTWSHVDCIDQINQFDTVDLIDRVGRMSPVHPCNPIACMALRDQANPYNHIACWLCGSTWPMQSHMEATCDVATPTGF